MPAHTPGPWEMVKDNMLDYAVLGHIGGERVIVADQLDEGDARLIAAGPEMYDYLVERAAQGDERARQIVAKVNA